MFLIVTLSFDLSKEWKHLEEKRRAVITSWRRSPSG